MQVWAVCSGDAGLDADAATAPSRPIVFSAASPLSVDDGSAYVALACAGLGVIQSPAYDMNLELAAGRLLVLMPQWRGPDIPFHAVYAKGRAQLPRVSAFVQWVSALLQRPVFSVPQCRQEPTPASSRIAGLALKSEARTSPKFVPK
jgi:DNA-binding transcriptional LysR family regulator